MSWKKFLALPKFLLGLITGTTVGFFGGMVLGAYLESYIDQEDLGNRRGGDIPKKKGEEEDCFMDESKLNETDYAKMSGGPKDAETHDPATPPAEEESAVESPPP